MSKRRKSRWSLVSLLLSEGQTAVYPETWRTLERMTHKEGPAFAQKSVVSFHFSLPVHTSVA